LLVESTLVVEIKTAKLLVDADQKQLFNYLRSTDLQLGLLLNFGLEPKYRRVISTQKKHQSVPLPLNPPDLR
jgi:GxxExxY protein